MNSTSKRPTFFWNEGLTDEQHEELYRLHRHLIKSEASRLYDLPDALRDQAVLAATDSLPYRGPEGVWFRWDCVHTISVLTTQ